MKIFNKILHSYAIYCRKEMIKTLKCHLIPKKSYDILSKGAIFLANPVFSALQQKNNSASSLIINSQTNNYRTMLIVRNI